MMGRVGLRSTVGWTRKTRTWEDRSASIPPSHRIAHHAKSLSQGFLTTVEDFAAAPTPVPTSPHELMKHSGDSFSPAKELLPPVRLARALMNVSR